MESVSIEKKKIKLILNQLNELLLMNDNIVIKDKINEIILAINEEIEVKDEIVIEDLIYKRMTEMKSKDEELHFKLYMLYRKLQDGKITESDAKLTYKSYFGMLQ